LEVEMEEVRRKKLAVYLFLGLTFANFGGWCVVNFVQAHQNGRGTGIGDTKIIEDDPAGFFEDQDIDRNDR
jgi:hypothetical protein